MTDQEQVIAQLTASVRELELRLQATIEVYSEYIKDHLIDTGVASENTPSWVISGKIDEALARLKKG